MTAAAARVPVRALAFHAGYACRSSGACCTSGWEIPIEPEPLAHVRRALEAGTLPLDSGARPFVIAPGGTARLGSDGRGRCAFFEAASQLCAIHRRLGIDAIPEACRQFPRIVRLSPDAVEVTLSHYCPTAAELLFAQDAPACDLADGLCRIVAGPPALAPSWPLEGLDARQALPPLLRPGVLMSWAALEFWEQHAVSTLAGARLAEDALDRLEADAERLRAWRPAYGGFDAHVERELARSEPALRAERPPATVEAVCSEWELVSTAIPRRHPRPASPRDRVMAAASAVAGVGEAAVAPAPDLERPISRLLAARAFGSWLALQGEGIRTTVVGLRMAHSVLRAECLRGCAEHGRRLDASLLKEALRRSDLLLVHLVDPQALARLLGNCESGSRAPVRG